MPHSFCRTLALLCTSGLTLLPGLPAAAQAPVATPALPAAPTVPAPSPPLAPAVPAAAAPAPLPVVPPPFAPLSIAPPSAAPLSVGAAAEPAAPATAPIDPPARVGRVAALRGTVSFHAPSDTQWQAASLNAPVLAGDGLWTEPGATAALQVSASTVVLAPATELDVTALDGRAVAVAQGLGEVYLHLMALAPGEGWSLATPRGTVTMARDGRYVVLAGDTMHSTVVTVLEGAAQISGGPVAVSVAAGQAATLSGTDVVQASLGPASRDAFVAAELAAEQAIRRMPLPAPVLRMTGCESLAQYGTWSTQPQYGAIWYPQVDPGWVPYREGRWSWVEPWGWTWVDDAPWGFAPFHYGRWLQEGGRWGWVPLAPGVPLTAQPVYAPALVSFGSFAAGAAVGFGAAELAGGPAVGWVPLGPREPFLPAFRASSRYVQQVNVTSVTNVAVMRGAIARFDAGAGGQARPEAGGSFAGLANRGGATVMPAAAMVLSGPVGRAARPLPAGAPGAQAGGVLRPAIAGPPVGPVAGTAGMTPAAVRTLGLATPAGGPGALRPAAPGPTLGARGPGGRPPLAQAAAAAAAVTEAPAQRPAGPPAAAALPPLRPPGAPSLQPGGAPGPRLDRPEGAPAAPGGAQRPEGPAPSGGGAPNARPPAPAPAMREEHVAPGPQPARAAPATPPPQAAREEARPPGGVAPPARAPQGRPTEARPPVQASQPRPPQPGAPRPAVPQPSAPRPPVPQPRPPEPRPSQPRPEQRAPAPRPPQQEARPAPRPEPPRPQPAPQQRLAPQQRPQPQHQAPQRPQEGPHEHH